VTELPAVRTLVVAGAQASTTILARWATGHKVYMAYGPAEAPFWAPLIVDAPARQRLVVGPPVTPTPLYLLDARGQPVPIGVPGELYIGGASSAHGYHDRPALTAERWVPNPFADFGLPILDFGLRTDSGPIQNPKSKIQNGTRLYRTRDRARALPDGTFELFGPRERHSRVRGFPVDLGVIADSLNCHPAVRESVVVARADGAGATTLVAYVVPTETLNAERRTMNEPDRPYSAFSVQRSAFVSELRDFLKARLPDYMLPAAIVPLDTLPLTPDGALDSAALPAATETALDAQGTPSGAPSSPDLALRQATLSSRRAELSSAKQALLQQRLRGKLTRPTSWSPVVAVQPTGTQRPFFCVHPVGGTVLCYVELARELGKDQPFYGLQSAGLDGARPPLSRIEDMATSYLDALRAIQPNGPYRLGGWSLGGVVVFEMAQQLHRRGVAVTLFMIDCMAPVELNVQDVAITDEMLLLGFVQDLASRLGKPMPLSEGELQQHAPEAQLPYLVERARQAQLLPPEIDVAQMQHMLDVYKANLAGMVQYRQQPYAGRIIMLRAQEELHRSGGDPTMGWSEVASGPVVIEVVPGNHYTILNSPQVQLLATKLGPLLAAHG
jgi:thioesterase domain-containing protein